MTSDQKFFESMGYTPTKLLPSGEWAGVQDYMFTAALVIGLDQTGWRTRYCFEHRADAEKAFEAFTGECDPIGPWIKQKPEERLNPNNPSNDEWIRHEKA